MSYLLKSKKSYLRLWYSQPFMKIKDKADMDYAISPITNCCLVDLEDMFKNGTVINDKLVETPKSFETACTVARHDWAWNPIHSPLVPARR